MGDLKYILKLCDLASQLDQPFPRLARELSRLHAVDPKTTEVFCKFSKMHIRKARYLIAIHRHLGHLGIAEERLVGIGWTKAAMIAPFASKANIEGLLHSAETMSAHNLSRVLRNQEPISESRCVTLYLSPWQHEVLTKCLAQFGYAGSGSHASREDALIGALLAHGPEAP